MTPADPRDTGPDAEPDVVIREGEPMPDMSMEEIDAYYAANARGETTSQEDDE